eukprot:COSAG04_NODE_31227_length_258_cov_0.578616_2_plen_46_part_01
MCVLRVVLKSWSVVLMEQAIEQVKRAQQQQVASLSERIKEETELRR